MSSPPFLNADISIQFHIAVALLSFVIGPVARASFTITSFDIVGPFSPIHLLAVWTLWSL